MKLVSSRPVALAATVLVALALSVPPAMAQSWVSFSAKFVCGAQQVPPPAALAIGRYKTIVNIHNPHYLLDEAGAPVPLVFYKKVVLSQRQGDEMLPPSCKQEERLRADHAVQMDCGNIKALLAASGLPATGPIEGFVVLEIPPQMGMTKFGAFPNVVAVYTSGEPGGEARSIDVEAIQPRSIIGTPSEDPCVPD